MLGGVLTDAVFAGVDHRGDLGGVGAAFRVGDGGDLGADHGPAGSGIEGGGAAAEAGVEDGGDVAGSGQVPFGDRGGQELGGVEPCEFRWRAGCSRSLIRQVYLATGRRGCPGHSGYK